MRKVDILGRIVIPLELREKYGLSEGAEIEFIDDGNGITVKPFEQFCRLCRGRISQGSALPLCEKCIAEVAKSYNKKDIKKHLWFEIP